MYLVEDFLTLARDTCIQRELRSHKTCLTLLPFFTSFKSEAVVLCWSCFGYITVHSYLVEFSVTSISAEQVNIFVWRRRSRLQVRAFSYSVEEPLVAFICFLRFGL